LERIKKMEMRVDRLREALNLLKPVAPKKTALPVLHNMLLKDGKAEATDLEVAVALDMPEVDGECLIPYRTVLELLKRIPGDETLTLEQKGLELNLTWSGGKASYDANDPKDYPLFPKVDGKTKHSVDGDKLVETLSSIADYCSTEEARPVLSRVTIYFNENLEVAASDGFRMAYQHLPIAFPVEGVENIIIPARAVRLLSHLWHKTPRTPVGDSLAELLTSKRQLELSLGGGVLGDEILKAEFGRVTLLTNLIPGTPPKFKENIPQEIQIEVRVMAPDFERAVRGISDVAKDNDGIVRLSWSKTKMTVSAKSEDKGQVETTTSVDASEAGKVAIDVKYLLSYLHGKEGVITMGAKGVQDPILFHYGVSPTVVIMPMFVDW
jgi:DNA polymerase-3 subunit beta